MRDRIVTFADKFGGRSLRAHASRCPSLTGDRTLPADGVALEIAAIAKVNHGRWIADCPFDGCGGAEYVHLDDPLFFCCECRNATVGHHPIKIALPSERQRSQIERVLLARPIAATRNWQTHENVADLKAENRDHGVPDELD